MSVFFFLFVRMKSIGWQTILSDVYLDDISITHFYMVDILYMNTACLQLFLKQDWAQEPKYQC